MFTAGVSNSFLIRVEIGGLGSDYGMPPGNEESQYSVLTSTVAQASNCVTGFVHSFFFKSHCTTQTVSGKMSVLPNKCRHLFLNSTSSRHVIK